MIMKKKIINFSAALFVLAIATGGLHFLSLRILPDKYHVEKPYEMHIFLFFITLLIYILLSFLLNKKKYLMGYGFMATSLLKMGFSVLFLLPQILHKSPTTKSYVIQFFILYFIYLAIEVVYLVKDLKSKNT
ncbi:MAG: hypothetical protein Kow0068_22480 [Marinilabiliales bacterium]